MFFQTMDWTGDGGPIFFDLRFADDILLFAGSAELINWWLHWGRSVPNSMLQKHKLWQLKRNHQGHWRPALVWRSKCWTSHLRINGCAACCPRLMQADGNTILTTDCNVRPMHFMLTKRFFATKWFQWPSEIFWCYDSSAVCFAGGHRKIYTNDVWKLDVHCRKLLRRVVGPPPDID